MAVKRISLKLAERRRIGTARATDVEAARSSLKY